MTTATKSNEIVPVAALVVGYMPEMAVLDALLLRLLEDASLVVLLDNGGASEFLGGHPRERERVFYSDMGGNLGLGAALNRGMSLAREAGIRYVITFDQDSAPPAGMVHALYAALCESHESGEPCAAIGPCFFDVRESEHQCFPIYRQEGRHIRVMVPESQSGLQQVDVLITSGMMVDSDVWAAGVRYEEGLMVDYTDTDWCFRARAAGKTLCVHTSVRMQHTLSDARPVRFMGLRLLRYSPLRRYYYFRNTVYFIRRSYVSGAWRRRLLAGLMVRLCSNVVLDEHRMQALVLSLKGIWHGLQGRLGRYPS